MSELQISPEMWRSNASHVGAVGDALEQVQAAADASMEGLPFGTLCSPIFLPPYLTAKIAFDDGVRDLSEELLGCGEDLQVVAEDFEAVDQDVAFGAHEIGGGGSW